MRLLGHGELDHQRLPALDGAAGQLAEAIPLTPVFEGSAGIAGAPWQGWAGLAPFTKAVLAAAMVAGRLEMLAILALLTPGAWKR